MKYDVQYRNAIYTTTYVYAIFIKCFIFAENNKVSTFL